MICILQQDINWTCPKKFCDILFHIFYSSGYHPRQSRHLANELGLKSVHVVTCDSKNYL